MIELAFVPQELLDVTPAPSPDEERRANRERLLELRLALRRPPPVGQGP
jgi:hypothetical protein